MIKFSECSAAVKVLVAAATIVSSIAVLTGAAAWAGDTRWVTVTAQAQSEQRQLLRDIKRLELKEESGTASPEDKAFRKFLEQDLESLKKLEDG